MCKQREARVHRTQIVGDKMHKVDLCDQCAAEKGVNDPTGFDLADLLLGLGSSQQVPHAGSSRQVRCPRCGFSHADFKKAGRLGWAALQPTLDRGHGEAPIHRGTTFALGRSGRMKAAAWAAWLLAGWAAGWAGGQARAPGAQPAAVEVVGGIHYGAVKFHQGLPAARVSEEYWFRATSDGARWFIRTEPLTNQVNTFDYCETAFDGAYLYSVCSIKSWFENAKATGQRLGKNTAVGYISKRPVPDYEINHEVGPLWLAYGSAAYFQGVRNGVIHCPAFRGIKALHGLSQLEDYRVRVQVEPGPAGIPARVTFLETNVPESVRFWRPAGLWWTNAVFAVQQFTNLGPFTVPLQATCKVSGPYRAPGKTEPEMLERYVYSIQAATVRLVPAPAAWRPELPEVTHIADLRFMYDRRRPIPAFHYFGQGQWLTEAEATRLPEYRKAAGLGPPSRLVGASAVRLLVVLALLAGPVLYFLLRQRRAASRP